MAPVVMMEIVYVTMDTTDPTAPVNIIFFRLHTAASSPKGLHISFHLDSDLKFYDVKLPFR